MLRWALFWFCRRQQLFNNERLISFSLKMPDFIDPSLGSYLRVLYLLCDCIISYINVFPANIFDLQDCLKTFSRLILKTSRRLLHDVLLRRVQDVLEDVFDTSSRRLERKEIVTLKTSSRRLEDMCVFKMFSRHVLKTPLRHVFKTFSRRLGDQKEVYWEGVYISIWRT